MGFDVRGTDYKAFSLISSGNYNQGKVVLDGDGLSKLNNHHYFGILNHRWSDAGANNRVRLQLYNAIKIEKGACLGDGQLEAIRKRLGINKSGDAIGDAKIGNKDLTRREVHQIISLVEEVERGNANYGAEKLVAQLTKSVDKTELSEEQKQELKKNLFGAQGNGGQLKALHDAFNNTILVKLEAGENREVADNVNPFGSMACIDAEKAQDVCENFIWKYVDFCKSAEGKIKTAADEKQKEINNNLAEQSKKLEGIQISDNAKNECKELIEIIRADAINVKSELENKLKTELAGLKIADLPKEADVESKSGTFVDQSMKNLDNICGQKINNLSTMLNKLEETAAREAKERRIKEEQEQAQIKLQQEAARLENEKSAKKVSDGLAKINLMFQETTTTLQKLGDGIEALKKFDPDLAMHERNDERCDGDEITVMLEEIRSIHTKFIEHKQSESNVFSDPKRKYTDKDIDQHVSAYKETLAILREEAVKKINEKIDKLNGELKFTKLPRFGEGPEDAAEIKSEELKAAKEQTRELRETLTKKLEGQWKTAADELDGIIASIKPDGREDCAYLTDSQKTELKEKLAAIKNRLGKQNHDVFVNNHPANGITPDKILAKAKEDVSTLMDNAAMLNDQEAHRTAENQLKILKRWVARDPAAMDTMFTDLAKLGGSSIKEFDSYDPTATACIKRCIADIVSGNIKTVEKKAEALRNQNSPENVRNLLQSIRHLALDVSLTVQKNEFGERAARFDQFFGDLTAELREDVDKLIADTGSLAGKLGEKEKNSLAVQQARRELKDNFDRMLAGFRISMEMRFVCKGGDGRSAIAEYVKEAGNLLASFKELAERRLLRDRISSAAGHLQSDAIDKANDQKCKEKDKAPLEQKSELLSSIAIMLDQENRNVGKTEGVSLKALQSVKLNVGNKVEKLSVQELQKLKDNLEASREEMSFAENNIKFANPYNMNVSIGKAPEAPGLSAGINDQLTKEPPVEVGESVLDQVVNANH